MESVELALEGHQTVWLANGYAEVSHRSSTEDDSSEKPSNGEVSECLK